MEGFDVKRYEGGLEDERRLFYVAMTRARDLLCFSFFTRINNAQSPSLFLADIQKHATKIVEENNLPAAEIKATVDSDEIQTFSPSEIIAYMRCPYLFCLREMWGYQPGLNIRIGYGKSLHHCMRCAGEQIKQGSDPAKAIKEVVRGKFHLPYAGGKPLETMRNTAEKVLSRFVTQHETDMKLIQEVEARLEFPLQKATISGKVDVIMRGTKKEPSVEVRDYKTSDVVTTFEESSLQLQLYTLGLKKLQRPVDIASVAYLDQKPGHKDIEQVSINQKNLDSAKDTAENAIKGIRQASYKARTGKHCEDRCDFPGICRYNEKR